MATSSSLSSENEATDHKFQLLHKPGPRGAYEARQANGGFYVRVDMPGVPPDGVKLVKRGETRTVTFTGKAPKLWPDSDTSDRVYAGYVVLGCNPDEVDVEMTVVNGSLKLFFPNTEGLLHFLPSKNPVPQQYPGQVKHLGDEKDCCFNKFVQCLDRTRTVIPGFENMTLHPNGCSCCIEQHKNNEEPHVPASDLINCSHINPYLLDGVRGVDESKLTVNTVGEQMYMRVDMPGLGEENNKVRIEKGKNLYYGGEGRKEHQLDVGGRIYEGGVAFRCDCCKMVDVRHEMKDGVLRVSFRIKRIKPGSSGMECKVAVLQRSRSYLARLC